MSKRSAPKLALLAVGLTGAAFGCRSARHDAPEARSGRSNVGVHYLEIVTDDVDGVAALYAQTRGLSFGPPDADLGQARVATLPDGSLLGLRRPLAAHEQPLVRAYLAVDDIQQAVKQAEAHGAAVAYPPTRQGARGTFAIVIQGGVQHGLWQR